MKVALFRHIAIAGTHKGAPGSEHLEHLREFTRVSEYVEVQFPPLASGGAEPAVSPNAPDAADDGCDDDYPNTSDFAKV